MKVYDSMNNNPTQLHIKPLLSRKEDLEKKPCATRHSNLLVEAWKRKPKE
jgi:hypothetical protein